MYIYIYAFSRRFYPKHLNIAFKLQFLHFYQLLLSLGIEPMILALLATIWATGKLYLTVLFKDLELVRFYLFF